MSKDEYEYDPGYTEGKRKKKHRKVSEEEMDDWW